MNDDLNEIPSPVNSTFWEERTLRAARAKMICDQLETLLLMGADMVRRFPEVPPLIACARALVALIDENDGDPQIRGNAEKSINDLVAAGWGLLPASWRGFGEEQP